jgi:hypothetical protein
MKFRKKPVVIEAVQIRKGMLISAPDWLFKAVNQSILDLHNVASISDGVPWAEIQTLEGQMFGREGDWIIRGVKGELYPCKPDIFEATYEAVIEDA